MHGLRGKRNLMNLSKQIRDVQCNDNEFYYDISAYGNLHASTASRCLVKIRESNNTQFSL